MLACDSFIASTSLRRSSISVGSGVGGAARVNINPSHASPGSAGRSLPSPSAARIAVQPGGGCHTFESPSHSTTLSTRPSRTTAKRILDSHLRSVDLLNVPALVAVEADGAHSYGSHRKTEHALVRRRQKVVVDRELLRIAARARNVG